MIKFKEANINGVKKNKINKKNKIFLDFKNIWKFEIKTKKIIANTTGIEDGLDTSNKKIIEKISK